MGPHKMQIEVIDDCSTDGNVEQLVKDIGKGRINFFQQNENVGSLRNFETCINRAKGQYIHLLHGDDLVKKGFYNEIESLFQKFPTSGSAITNFNWVNENEIENLPSQEILKEPGIIDNWLLKIASKQMIQPPAVVVKRSVYEELGSFFGVHYGEDWEMWIRIASRYPVAYSPKCLATYRGGHSTNISSEYVATGKNIDDILKVIEIVQDYLPVEQKEKVKKAAKNNFAISYAKSAYRILKVEKNKKLALILVKGSLKLSMNIRTAYWISCLYIDFEVIRRNLKKIVRR
jgi:glycosyltransferase involved in cell wall biosynthesis